MKIGDINFTIQDVSNVLTVPDCTVKWSNKLGGGHGEAKFYLGSKDEMNAFTLNNTFIKCFFLKADLLAYMYTAQKEYQSPSQNYNGKANMPILWNERVARVQKMPDIIYFEVENQTQIQGTRGYVNSKDEGYDLFRELSLPLISYVSIMRLKDPDGNPVFYWKLFVDFDAIMEKKSVGQVFTYGQKGKVSLPQTATPSQPPAEKTPPSNNTGRDAAAQANYRKKLLEECPFCPITKITDERLLIASHIKPFAVSDDNEAFDPKNGFMLSPLFDRLFDQGFITFDDKKCMMVSNWLSPSNQTYCQIKNGTFIQALPLDEKREKYLQYHRKLVFKG